MGFRLADICRMLSFYDDRQRLDECLAAQQAALEAQAEDVARKLRLLDSARKRLRKEDTMAYNVTVKTLPQRYAACVRMTIPCYEQEGTVWGVLCAETDHMNLIPDDPCYCSVTFLDAEYKEKDVEVEAQKTVKGQYPDTEHVKFRTLPAVTYAGCTYQGGYEHIGEVNAARGRVDRGQRLPLCRPHVQHLPRQPPRDPEPRRIRHRGMLPHYEIRTGRPSMRWPSLNLSKRASPSL